MRSIAVRIAVIGAGVASVCFGMMFVVIAGPYLVRVIVVGEPDHAWWSARANASLRFIHLLDLLYLPGLAGLALLVVAPMVGVIEAVLRHVRGKKRAQPADPR